MEKIHVDNRKSHSRQNGASNRRRSTSKRPDDSINQWHWETDAKGALVSFSENFEQLTGCNPEVLLGRTFEEMSESVFDASSDSAGQIKRYLARVQNRRGFRNVELPINSVDNGVRFFRINGRPVLGARRKFLGFAGSGSDFTAEFELQSKVTATYIPLAEILHGLGNGFALADQRGRLLLFNVSFKNIFASKPDLVKSGASLYSLSRYLRTRVITIEPDTKDNLFAVGRNKDRRKKSISRRSKETIEREVQYFNGDWAQITVRPMESGLSAITVTDISRIKLNEIDAQRDAQRNAQMSVAISAMDSGVIITNPNLPNNPVVFLNSAYVPPIGMIQSEILGEPFASLFHSPKNKKIYAELNRGMKNKKTVNVILGTRDAGDEGRWFDFRVNPVLGNDNRVSYYLGIQTDITAQKNAEFENERRMQFQSAVAELGHRALTTIGLDKLFDDAVKLVAKNLNVQFVDIRELLPDDNEFIIKSGIGWKPGVVGKLRTRRTKNSFIDKILKTGKTNHIIRSEKQALLMNGIRSEEGLKHSVAAPIFGRESPFGILEIHTKEVRDFSLDDVSFLESVAYVLGVAVERTEAEDAIRKSEHRFELAVKGSNDGIWDWELETDKLYLSERWKSMLGLTDELMESSFEAWQERIQIDDKEVFQLALDNHLNSESPYFSCEHRLLHHDGSYRWMLARGLAVRDENGKAIRLAGSLSDITENKRAQTQLLEDALHDTLTGLPNRALFTDRLTQAISRSTRISSDLFAVLFLDFDRFKLINDSLGHSYGDQILIEISHRLRECTRGVDTVARLGGDEFAMLLVDLDSESTAEEVARRINKSLADPFHIADRKIVSNASIGIAFSSSDYNHPEEMVRDADIAMYQAKNQGRGRHIVFETGMHVHAVSQLELETDLRRAIENEEFFLVYQPVVDASTQVLEGFEALIRWKHPTKGEVPPGDFIPTAEETKLIIPIGKWVLEEACRQMHIWETKFPNKELAMSVNISPEQFSDPNLITDIKNILADSHLLGQHLKVEITESAIMENPHEVTNRLLQLRKMGVHLHVDDFGTGYSSLSHLHRFPINALKVDRSFVISMGESEENMEIVRTIISLAHNLKLRTVAEGVETLEDLIQLEKLGCDLAQGYYFSKPMIASKATKYITKKRKK